jgi:hypothetical protein
LVELMTLSNFVVLLGRAMRRHALLVWLCVDRVKIFKYFGVSGAVLVGLWYVLFFNWDIMTFVMQYGGRARGMVPFAVVILPMTALVAGHMSAIVGAGAWRAAARRLRRFRIAAR